MYVCEQVSMCMCIYIYIYIVYIYIYTHIRAYTYTHTFMFFSFDLSYDSWHDQGVLLLILLAPVLRTCRSRTLKCNRID